MPLPQRVEPTNGGGYDNALSLVFDLTLSILLWLRIAAKANARAIGRVSLGLCQ